MNKNELNEARTNPEFLKYLQATKKEAIAKADIGQLYHVLDSMLVLDLEEEEINEVYENILKIAFSKVEEKVNEGTKLTLVDEDLYYVRAFYEHAIEKWTNSDNQGANEIFFVLANIVDNADLALALKVHLIDSAKGLSAEEFYSKVDTETETRDVSLGYFLTVFNFDEDKYVKDNKEILEKEYHAHKHILGLK